MINFIAKHFMSLSLGWRIGAIAIVAAVCFAAGGLTAWSVRGAYCDSDKVGQLEADIKARDLQLQELKDKIAAQNSLINAAGKKNRDKDQEINNLKGELEISYEKTPPTAACFTAERLSILDRARQASNRATGD